MTLDRKTEERALIVDILKTLNEAAAEQGTRARVKTTEISKVYGGKQ
ncbi:MAG: hypothetical protein ACP5HH_01100 [Fervidicoccaceae archaeon]